MLIEAVLLYSCQLCEVLSLAHYIVLFFLTTLFWVDSRAFIMGELQKMYRGKISDFYASVSRQRLLKIMCIDYYHISPTV